MKKFCTRRNETIELKEMSGSFTCIPYGPEVECTEAGCVYSLAATLRTSLFGSAGPGFVDYTQDLKDTPDEKTVADKGPSKICDVCSKAVYREDAFLFDTDIILASDKYIDFVIRGWIDKRLLPPSALSGGINNQMRAAAREDVRRQGGGTPWLVCKSCLPMFSVKEKDLEEAKKRADEFWK